jgi:hypothetical protein
MRLEQKFNKMTTKASNTISVQMKGMYSVPRREEEASLTNPLLAQAIIARGPG